jgi:lysophospholipase L1-like esterase
MPRSVLLALLVGLAALTQACSARLEEVNALRPAIGGSGNLPPTVAWYGDSIVAGACQEQPAPATLGQMLGPPWSVQNHGVSGEAAAHIRQRYEASWSTACHGQACGWYLIQGGVNSVKGTPYVSPAATLADMVAMVDDARARGSQVVWFGILPFKGCTLCQEDTTPGVARALEYNALMAEACADRPDVICLQLYSEFEDPDRPDFLKPEYSCDGIHLNQRSAEQLATKVRGLFPQ